MSDNLYKVFELEEELIDNVYNKDNKNDLEEKIIIFKIENLLSKLNNKELLYILKEGTYIHEVIDVAKYFKKYHLNKKELRMDNSYKDELKKLNNFIELINYSSINESEYMYICSKCDVDNVAKYLLSNMSNNDIMKLSNESDDWNYKLFLYGNLKI